MRTSRRAADLPAEPRLEPFVLVRHEPLGPRSAAVAPLHPGPVVGVEVLDGGVGRVPEPHTRLVQAKGEVEVLVVEGELRVEAAGLVEELATHRHVARVEATPTRVVTFDRGEVELAAGPVVPAHEPGPAYIWVPLHVTEHGRL